MGSVHTLGDLPDVDSGVWGVEGIGALIGKVVLMLGVSSELVAVAHLEATNVVALVNSSGVRDLVSKTSFVVESLLGEDWTLYASGDLSPLMWSSSLTDLDLLVDKLTTEESAVSSILPHVPDGFLSVSDLASWKGLGSEGGWESPLLEHVEWSTDLWSSWGSWVDVNSLSVLDPFSSLESVPHAVDILEDPTVVMPVSLIPGPSLGGESVLGWSPVMPFTHVPSEPNFILWIPFPDNLWCLGMFTPVADLRVASIFLNESQASGLSVKNVVVLLINLSFSEAIVLLV